MGMDGKTYVNKKLVAIEMLPGVQVEVDVPQEIPTLLRE
jgi:hypothetical protein